MLSRDDTGREVLRYAATGLAANGALYVAYLLLNSCGIEYKAAMTVTYAAGVACTFTVNRRWTFAHRGAISSALIRYVAVYAVGYLANLGTLAVAVGVMGWPHQWTMAALIVVSAFGLFLAQKYWVFPTKRHASHAALTRIP